MTTYMHVPETKWSTAGSSVRVVLVQGFICSDVPSPTWFALDLSEHSRKSWIF